jgi:hypothetical protein
MRIITRREQLRCHLGVMLRHAKAIAHHAWCLLWSLPGLLRALFWR